MWKVSESGDDYIFATPVGYSSTSQVKHPNVELGLHVL